MEDGGTDARGRADGRPAPGSPAIPARLLDPRPVLAAGTALWALALVAAVVVGRDRHDLTLCAIGVALGACGYGVYTLQRRAVQRGRRGAQVGLEGLERLSGPDEPGGPDRPGGVSPGR